MMNLVPIQSSSFDNLDLAIWQWQAGPNPDPWAEKDPNKWIWQTYSDADCLTLEQAHFLNKNSAELKGYDIDLKRMIQVNKQFKDRMRRVRRLERSRFLIETPPPVVVGREQKTMNEAFGTIQHFLDYIMKRTPKSYDLYQRLKDLSLESQNSEFKDVINEVVFCIEKGAEFRQQRTKNSTTQDFIAQGKRIIDVIRQSSTSLRDFLKAILKVYTMETFVCYWLNELLRSENWEEMNVLTPYLVCLVYTFKFSSSVIDHENRYKLLKSFVGTLLKQRLHVFRGTALKKDHLELYDPKKVEYFSWNGVTSTSSNKNVAMNFLQMSLATSKEPKIGVLFSIDMSFATIKDHEGIIDVSKSSQYPDEKEIILAPGTVFKLQKTRLIENGIYEISLKVTKKFKKIEKDKVALLGNLQHQTIYKDIAFITDLSSQKSLKLLELLKGNKMIHKIKIINSEIKENLLEEIENVRLTTNVKKQDIQLRSNKIHVGSLGLLAHYFSAEQLNDICSNNKVSFVKGTVKNNEGKIKTLTLNGSAFNQFDQSNQMPELWANIKNESQITDLDLSLDNTESKDETLSLVGCIKELRYLKNLTLKLSETQMRSKEGLEFFCKMIGSLSGLDQIHLKFPLINENINFLEKAFSSFAALKNLSLDFDSHKDMSNEGLNHLSNALRSIPSLQHLSLGCDWCEKVSDEGLYFLRGALAAFTSLKSLSMNLFNYKISNEGLMYLKNALTTLTALQRLSLNLYLRDKITDEGFKHLEDGLASFTSLKYLSLDFTNCTVISEGGLKHLKDGLVSLVSLQHLSLNFQSCTSITDEGLKRLKDGLTPLISLKYLSLIFQSCYEITDEGLNHLKEALKSLISLQRLSLNFNFCDKISDDGLKHLKDGLTTFASLQYLSLQFTWCSFSDQAFNHLKDILVRHTSLKFLCLAIHSNNEISDKGLNYLKDGLIPLTSLKELSIYLSPSSKLSDKGLAYLRLAFFSLTSLTKLHVLIPPCSKISLKAKIQLTDGLTNISSYTSDDPFPHIPELEMSLSSPDP